MRRSIHDPKTDELVTVDFHGPDGDTYAGVRIPVDLDDGIRKGLFRADLFYRLSVFPIALPPLRERRADTPALAEYFVRRFADREHKPVPQLSEQAMASLINYNWPGNIRELQNIIERAVILVRGSVIEPELMAIALHRRHSERTVPRRPPLLLWRSRDRRIT